MKNLKGKTAVITGAASGIGRALALALAGEGCSLAIADINKKDLDETAKLVQDFGATVTEHIVNVADRKEVAKFAKDVVKAHGGVDILINNAGVSLLGNTVTLDYSDFEWIIGINLWGVIHGAKEFLPFMMEKPEAAIVNISSVFGLLGITSQSAYCATKFGVRGFSESLRKELSKTGVSVITVHPGGVKTNIARDSRIVLKKDNKSFNKDRYLKQFDKLAGTSPEAAALKIVNGIKKNSPRVLIGKDAWIFDKIQRIFPGGYYSVLKNL